MKEGYKTSEFWVALFGALLGIAVILGYLEPDQATALTDSASQIAGAIVSALSILGYSISRGIAKKPQ